MKNTNKRADERSSKMKKYVAIFLICLMSLCTIVASASTPNLNVVLSTSDLGDDQLILEVTDAPQDALMGIAIFNEKDTPVFLEDKRVESTVLDKTVFDFTSEFGISGKLKVRVSFADNDAVLEKEISYYTYGQQQTAIGDILSSENPAADIVSKKDILGINLDGLYAKVSDKDAIATRTVNSLKTAETVNAAKFNEAFQTAVLVTALNEDNAKLIEELIKDNLIGFDQTIKEYFWYNDLTNKDKIYSDMTKNSYNSVDEFNDKLKSNLFLAKINTLHITEMLDVLKYADGKYQMKEETFDLDFEAYNELDEAKKEYFVTQLKTSYLTLEDVKEVFDAALLAAQEYDEKEDDDEGSFSGGGGGAGGGGGSSKDSRIPIAKVEKAAESTMFKDVSHVSWAKEAIETFAKNGIVSGTGNNNFSPDANVTREQFVKMLLGTFGISANNVESVTDFSDVDKNAWYYKYVQTAVSMGLASGYGDSFGVGDFITREDMSVMIYKAAALKKVAINAISENAPSDYAEISAYAQESVDALYKAGIINGVGDGKFAPKAKATRAQAVKLLYELWRVAK